VTAIVSAVEICLTTNEGKFTQPGAPGGQTFPPIAVESKGISIA
jgi:hypothetical protein